MRELYRWKTSGYTASRQRAKQPRHQERQHTKANRPALHELKTHAAALVDEVASGGRLAGVDVTDHCEWEQSTRAKTKSILSAPARPHLRFCRREMHKYLPTKFTCFFSPMTSGGCAAEDLLKMTWGLLVRRSTSIPIKLCARNIHSNVRKRFATQLSSSRFLRSPASFCASFKAEIS